MNSPGQEFAVERSPESLAEEIHRCLVELRKALRRRYKSEGSQVTANGLRDKAKNIAEAWLTELATNATKTILQPDVFANLTLDFEGLLQAAGRLSTRGTYLRVIDRICQDYPLKVVVPLKRARVLAGARIVAAPQSISRAIVLSGHTPTVFVGHSFLPEDADVAEAFVETLRAVGLSVFTGEKPKADRISEKVKELIESQDIFIGVFTRRDKLHGKNEWTTSTWVIEEKTWAMACERRIILVRETGVKNLGGFHADHEYIELDRSRIGKCLVKLLQMFDIKTTQLR